MPGRPTRYDEALGHYVRSDGWPEQGRSSYDLARAACSDGRAADAEALARMTVQEAQEAFDLYVLWLARLPELLGERGVPDTVLDAERRASATVRGRLEVGWTRYGALVDQFTALAHAGELPQAAEALERARSTWLEVHDPATDRLAGLLATAARELGEKVVGGLWDDLLQHYYEGLAERYDPTSRPWRRSLERLGLDIFEAVRGHLTGPERDGSFEVREEEDRWVLEFAPCGSGGRTYPDADPFGSGSSAPDESAFTTEEHDWAWRTRGVCLYCVHCCQLQQRAPIERVGIPLRVIQPPVRASDESAGRAVCTWSLYKDPSKVPDHAYTDVGAVPPSGTLTQSP